MKKIISLFITLILIMLMLCSCSKPKTVLIDKNDIDLPVKFTYDAAYEGNDESVYNAYESVCRAIFNAEDEVRFNTGMLDDVQRMLYTSFPLNKLVSDIGILSDNSGIKITYVDDIDTTKENARLFCEKINDIISECESSSDLQYTLNIYKYISENIVICDDGAISCYETVMNGQGSAFSYANLFEYLLSQHGIKAYHVIATESSGITTALSQALINGQYYYFKPYEEFIVDKGTKLLFFGMTDKETDCKNFMYSDSSEVLSCSDKSFKKCRNADSYEIQDGKLILIAESDTYEIPLE